MKTHISLPYMGAGVGVGARKDINTKDLIKISHEKIQDTQKDKDPT